MNGYYNYDEGHTKRVDSGVTYEFDENGNEVPITNKYY